MPLCYGGGVTTAEQTSRSSASASRRSRSAPPRSPIRELLPRACERVGRQSIVVVIDVKKVGKRDEVFTHNGTRATGLEPAAFAARIEQLGAGEIVVNAIDRDGVMKGYDLELMGRVRDAVTLPLTALGGAGSTNDIAELIRRFGIVGAAAGSLFVFKGVYRAVLINYPKRADKDALIAQARQSA